ncbi:MAG: class II glutamine amidotransferase [Acidobacteriota bacterium]
MCRFVLYLGDPIRLSSLITDPDNSLIHQSFHSHERREPLNGDGFGLTWYPPDANGEPALFRSISPAWNNRNLRELARITTSHCVLAHVRAASQGSVCEPNCHPFKWRSYAFMHNGNVGGFQGWKRHLIEALSDEAFATIEGNTDSEHLFALLIDEIRATSDADSGTALGRAMERTLNKLLTMSKRFGGGACYLNLAVSDGRSAVVTRCTTEEKAATLHLHAGRSYTCEEGLCRMIEPEEGAGAVIVSSERLSDDPGWSMVPMNHMVTVGAGGQATVTPLELDGLVRQRPG